MSNVTKNLIVIVWMMAAFVGCSYKMSQSFLPKPLDNTPVPLYNGLYR